MHGKPGLDYARPKAPGVPQRRHYAVAISIALVIFCGTGGLAADVIGDMANSGAGVIALSVGLAVALAVVCFFTAATYRKVLESFRRDLPPPDSPAEMDE